MPGVAQKYMFDEMLEALKRIWVAESVVLNSVATQGQLNSFENKFKVNFPLDIREYFAKINGMPEGYYDGSTRLWPLDEVCPLTEYISLSSSPVRTVQEETFISEFNNPLAPEWHRLKKSGQLRQEEIRSVSLDFLLPDAESYFLFGDYNFGASHWAIKLGSSLESDNPVLSIYDFTNVYHRVANNFHDFIAQYIAESPDVLI